MSARPLKGIYVNVPYFDCLVPRSSEQVPTIYCDRCHRPYVSPKSMSDLSRLTMSNGEEHITSKLTRLANPPLSPVKTLRRLALVSRQNVRILEGSISGFPFVLADFKRRLFKVSRDAVVWKRFSGSLETLILNGDRPERRSLCSQLKRCTYLCTTSHPHVLI